MDSVALHAGDERAVLTGLLDRHRALLVDRCKGLDVEQLHRRVGASALTLGRLLRHLTFVEVFWFSYQFAGDEMPEPWASADWDTQPDWEMDTADGMDPGVLLADYAAACARSREVVAAVDDLDTLSVRADGIRNVRYRLRWVLAHVLEETAQHNGHADLLREGVDGRRG